MTNPLWENSREVLVQTLSSECTTPSSCLDREEQKESGRSHRGKVGYVYVADTGRGGQSELVRQFALNSTKPAWSLMNDLTAAGRFLTASLRC